MPPPMLFPIFSMRDGSRFVLNFGNNHGLLCGKAAWRRLFEVKFLVRLPSASESRKSGRLFRGSHGNQTKTRQSKLK
jgi:hypothetical protein